MHLEMSQYHSLMETFLYIIPEKSSVFSCCLFMNMKLTGGAEITEVINFHPWERETGYVKARQSKAPSCNWRNAETHAEVLHCVLGTACWQTACTGS